MPDHRYTVSGQINLTPDDEDEEEKRTPGRPNAWWAEHKSDIDDATGRAATFDSAVRGVSQGPHGGSSSVGLDDVTGSIDYCWCGLPFDHDWPGKERGRKHPREGSMSTAAGSTRQHIERRQLRAYNDDLVDVIVEAVNGYNARYRMQKNGVVLFPPDGTQGITLNARASARQVKSARVWFLRHCVGVGEDGQPTNPLIADPEVVAEDHAKRVERLNQEARQQAREDLNRSLSEPEVEPEPAAETAAEPEESEEEWIPYVQSDGETVNEYFETNGTIFRCKVCNGTGSDYETEDVRGIGGHIRARHRDTTNLHSPEARAKATESKRLNRLTREVEGAVEALNKALGRTVDTNQIDTLKAENAALRQRAEDAEAKLALIREASGL